MQIVATLTDKRVRAQPSAPVDLGNGHLQLFDSRDLGHSHLSTVKVKCFGVNSDSGFNLEILATVHDVLAAMEKQMRAEREKRALILTSEGQRDAAINSAEGEKQQVIKASEANKQQQINEAEGEAAAILAFAEATSSGIRKVAESIQQPGGFEAV